MVQTTRVLVPIRGPSGPGKTRVVASPSSKSQGFAHGFSGPTVVIRVRVPTGFGSTRPEVEGRDGTSGDPCTGPGDTRGLRSRREKEYRHLLPTSGPRHNWYKWAEPSAIRGTPQVGLIDLRNDRCERPRSQPGHGTPPKGPGTLGFSGRTHPSQRTTVLPGVPEPHSRAHQRIRASGSRSCPPDVG